MVKIVVKIKIINVAGQMFIQYENELDDTNQKIKTYENYISDDKIKNDVSHKVYENNMTEKVNSEKDEINNNNSTNRFSEILNYKKVNRNQINNYCRNKL